MESKKFWIRDGCSILAIILLGFILRLIVLSNTVVTARDSIGFIRYALNLENPPAGMTSLDVVRKELHPPGYVTMVMLVSKPVRQWMGGTSAQAMTLSCQIVSVLASLLLVIPMYYLGLRLFDRRVAVISCILFQVLPVCVQITSDGLSDSLFLLTIFTAVWLGVRALESPGFVRFVLAGMASGSAYLIRPEGLIVVAALGFTGILLKAMQRITWSTMLSSGVALTVGIIMTGGPYVAIIGKLTNKTTGNGLIEWIKGEDNGPVWKARPVEEAQRVVDIPLAAWWNDGINKDENKLIWGLKSLAAETLKTSHYFGLFLAGFGLVCFGRRIRESSGMLFVVTLMIMHAGLLWVMAAKIGYVSQRHTLLIVSLGLYFSASGLIELIDWLNQLYSRNGLPRLESIGKRFGLASAVALLVIVSLPSALKPLHANRAGHRAAGEWLAVHAAPEAVIWDPFAWSEFYAGRSMYVDPDRNYTRAETYVILEPFNPNPHSKLPMIPVAKAIAEKGKIVYHWPEHQPLEKAKVVIYLITTDARAHSGITAVDSIHTLACNGVIRRYLRHSPIETRRLPTVIFLHGRGGTAEWAAEETGWSQLADQENFAVLYPEGLPPRREKAPKFLTNPPFWNDGSRNANEVQLEDDSHFISQMLEHEIAQGIVDPQKVFLTGFSNGAGMVFRLAMELPGRFQAIAPVAGICRWTVPDSMKPVPTCYILGEKDPLIPLNGGTVKTPWGTVETRQSVQVTIENWKKTNGFTIPISTERNPIHQKTIFRSPTDRSEFEIIEVTGLGHHWPGGKGGLGEKMGGPIVESFRANEYLWNWFQRWKSV